MSLSASFLSEDQLTCSICLDVFSNPVSTPCGHSFCLSCISSYWDVGGGATGGAGGVAKAKAFLCPLCKEAFRKRPELHVNRTLKEITEQFKHMADSRVGEGLGGAGRGGGGGQDEEEDNSHPHHHPRTWEMPGSVLAEMRTRFQRSPSTGTPPSSVTPLSPPLHLPTSPPYPQTNAHPHHDPPPSYSPPRRSSLSGPSDSSPNVPLCPTHLRGLEFFCHSDQTCVCSVCLETAEHRGHNAIPAKREWHIKKSQLGITEVELRDLISERERKITEIHNSLQDIQACAERETEGSVRVFSQLVSCVERSQAEVLEMIEMSRRSAQHRAQSLIRELEQEVEELRKRSAALNQLAQSEDYVLFLKTFPSLSSLPQVRDWSDARVTSELSSGVVLRSVTQMMESFQEELRKLPEMFQRSPSPPVSRPNPKVRRVQEYAADVTLDPVTAHPRLIISVDGKQVCCGDRYQAVPDNPERFDRVVCVLARQGFTTGRHYWEVDVGGKTDWDLGVASRSINRKGKITVSPAHGYWFLSLRDRTDYAFRSEPSTSLGLNLRPSRIGIYVDCDKGQVSFYNVEAKVLIYTFMDSFSDTIHPFFSPCTNKSGRNEAPLIICPVAPVE